MFPPFVVYFYAIFVPFTTNAALLCAGLVLFVIGLALLIKQMRDFATAPPDQLITHGTYQISRNPSYFGSTLIALGMGLAGGSWLIVAFAVYWFIVYQWAATLEERFCMARWPEELSEYKLKVAKNFLFF
jgi:protein-S-isoprenylcysteine O-methyltransferase Ste14